MTRAAILPTTGDPYVSQLWANSCERVWGDEVDKIYVKVNSSADESVREHSADIYRSLGAKVSVVDHPTDHGPAVTDLIHEVEEDHILILEDDFYIKQPGAVTEWFEEVESGACDVVGSMRGCTDAAIIEKTAQTFGLAGDEALQSNFWPCLLVASKHDLLRTDENFAAKTFEAGKAIPYIDHTPAVTCAGDTFVWASIQLRGLGFRCNQRNQWRLIDVLNSEFYDCPWVHLGSSSTTDNGMLVDENWNSILLRHQGKRGQDPTPPDEGLKDNYCCQMAWLALMLENLPVPAESNAAWYNGLYGQFINSTIVERGLSPSRIVHYADRLAMVLAPLL